MMLRACRALLVLVAIGAALPTCAHELRPAYLELAEQAPGSFHVTWKVPRVGDATLALEPRLPEGESTPPLRRAGQGSMVETWTARLGELRGREVAIDGFDSTLTDALVRIELAGGHTITQRLDARTPSFTVPQAESAGGVARTYLGLGIEHILLGFDHLLFVATLVLLTGWGRSLLGAVTAFTVAHSITLGLASLDLVRVAQAPVEAIIALSIAFMAVELLHQGTAREGLASRSTWIVAFCFGLLHGLGFAGALSGIGLPQGHVPLALLLFNAGVELGQLLFLAALFAAGSLTFRFWNRYAAPARVAGAYAIGSVSMFWLIGRIAAF